MSKNRPNFDYEKTSHDSLVGINLRMFYIQTMLAKKLGRPTKFSTEKKKTILKLYRGGKTDVQVSVFVGVTERTLNNWKAKDEDFFLSIKEAKEEADGYVTAALFRLAIGHTKTLHTTCPECGSWAKTTKEIPPDVRACIFWLRNRSEKWM